MFSVTRNDKPVSEDLYNWDESTKTFSSNEDGLVLDFNEYDVTFITGSDCTFNTSSDCTFDTGSSSVIIRRDEFEVITLEEGGHIKLNEFRVKGYTHIKDTKTITIDGKDIGILPIHLRH